MKTFKQYSAPEDVNIIEYSDSIEEGVVDAAKARLKKVKPGSSLSFTHHKQGKVTGKYKGMGQMGGKSFAKIDTGKELHYVPPHEVHEEVEQIDEVSGSYYTANFSKGIGVVRSLNVKAKSEKEGRQLAEKDFIKEYGKNTGYKIVDFKKKT